MYWMRKFSAVLTSLLFAAALAVASPAAATHYLVDTGVGTDFNDAPYLYNFGNNNLQFEAVQFFVPDATIITSIEGALAPRVADSTLTIKLYTTGAGDTPETSFFAQAVSVPDGMGFHGVSGIAVPVTRGYYYAAFEVADGQTFNGYEVAGAPNPQSREAYLNCCTNNHAYQIITNRPVNSVGTLGLGLRVGDSPSGVPEPAAWSLMVIGVGVAGAALRRRTALVSVG